VEIFVTTGEPFLDALINGGPIAFFAIGLFAFYKGWIVPGSQIDELNKQADKQLEACEKREDQLRTERDRALELVYKQAEATNRALEVAEKVKRQ
jgi:hypothetical protein